MNNKIISPNRYKKVNRKKYEKYKKRKKNNINLNFDFKKVIIFIICVISLIGIYFFSKYISNLNYDKYLTVFNDDGEKVTVNLNYNLNIGVLNLDRDNNVLVNELNDNVYRKLLDYDENFNITYDLLESIEKKDDLTYFLTLKDNKYIEEIVNYLESKNYSVNIDNLKLTVKLNEKNEYFPYYLNEYIIESGDYEVDIYKSDRVEYNFNDKIFKTSIKNISILDYDNTYDLIEDFKEAKIDGFLTSNEQDIRLIGKYEYNSKKYRNGESIFLTFNKDNEILSNLDVRKSIVQCINRDEIIKDVSKKFTEKIDIPYINSNIRYKYDIYGIENTLNNNGYVKRNGIYYKDGKMLSFDLAVNKEDSIKLKIAEDIKLMLEENGIRINIKYQDNINDYDIALLTFNLNNNPDINYLKEYININEEINDKIKLLETSDIVNLANNINNLKETVYNQYACFGILAKDTHIVYQKYINGIENLSYLNLFNSLENVGKILK